MNRYAFYKKYFYFLGIESDINFEISEEEKNIIDGFKTDEDLKNYLESKFPEAKFNEAYVNKMVSSGFGNRDDTSLMIEESRKVRSALAQKYKREVSLEEFQMHLKRSLIKDMDLSRIDIWNLYGL